MVADEAMPRNAATCRIHGQRHLAIARRPRAYCHHLTHGRATQGSNCESLAASRNLGSEGTMWEGARIETILEIQRFEHQWRELTPGAGVYYVRFESLAKPLRVAILDARSEEA
ncbi:MAG: hypothetical protein FJ318_08180 [SAR202 cluster bacterium]|nr:hypothetical protein [SAR202 cluster bacterium]